MNEKQNLRLKRNVGLDYVHTFLSNMNMQSSIWVLYLAYCGLHLAQIGLLEGIYHATSIVCEIPSGAAADLWGRKRCMVLSNLCIAVSCVIMLFSKSFGWFAVSFAVQALGNNLNSGSEEALVYDSMKCLGQEEHYMGVYGRLNVLIEVAQGLATVAGGVLAGGWLISFLSNLMRHWNFSCTRCADLFIIRSGIGTRRRHVLYRDRVNYIDLRQSLLMKICKITSVSAHCTGYGKRRLEISALIPITTNGQVDRSLKMLMPKIPPVKSDISTGKADLGRFITIPLICTFIPIVSGRGTLYFFPNWKREITILVILTTIPLLWLVIVKAAAAFTTSIGFENGHCTLSYCKWYSFHKSIAALDRVSMVTVMQNPFQKISHTCAVRVYTNSESTDYHTVKGLNYDKVIKLLNRNGYAV